MEKPSMDGLSGLNRAGVQASFVSVQDSLATPDEVVILIGINDLISLIYSSTTSDRFIPGTVKGDFDTGGGILPIDSGNFTDDGVYVENVTYNSGSDTYHYPALDPITRPAFNSLIDRYEDLINEVRAKFTTTHLFLVPVPIPDAAGMFSDVPFQTAKVDLKPTVKQFNTQIIALASTLGSRYSDIDSRIIEPINISDSGSPAYVESSDLESGDGSHPSQDGYDKIGRAIANVIL